MEIECFYFYDLVCFILRLYIGKDVVLFIEYFLKLNGLEGSFFYLFYFNFFDCNILKVDFFYGLLSFKVFVLLFNKII